MNQQTLIYIVWLIPLLPLLSFFVIMLFTRKHDRLSHSIAIGAMAISFVLAQIIFWNAVTGGTHAAEQPAAAAEAPSATVEHPAEGTATAEGEHGYPVFVESSIPWLPQGLNTLNMGVLVDPVTAVMLFMVPLACLMIFIYSVGYGNFNKKHDAHDQPGFPPHKGREPMYPRFFAFLSLFAGAMLTLVVADNLLMVFIGWEVMGLCSYLLIGFWYARTYPDPRKITPRGAAVKAFMTTRVADVFMLLGIAFLYTAMYAITGESTLSFKQIFTPAVTEALGKTLIWGIPVAFVIYMLLFIGTIGKSAQFPLHTWLPDAMEGPTPVSAMIHAAAMVSAGVYMVIRMFPILGGTVEHGELVTFTPMIIIGTFTALFAATIAFTQRDVKKVLAYSTISQLGFMISALGMGAWVAALFHLITHAFFKALLFMGSGSIIHGVEHGLHATHEAHETSAHYEQVLEGHAAESAHADDAHGHADADPAEPDLDPQDMFNMGGLRKKMPITFWTFLIGGLSLAGFPIVTAGFWSKDEILDHAFSYPQYQIVFWVLVFTAFLTAFYTMRQISLTFFGKPRTKAAGHAHESHWTMLLPLVILVLFAIFAGFMGVKADMPALGLLINGPFSQSGTPFEHFVEPVLATTVELKALPFEWLPLLIASTAGVLGLVLGWLIYGRKPLAAGQPDPLEVKMGGLYVVLKNKYYIDEFYAAAFVQPSRRFAGWMGETFDRKGIDGVLHGIANGAMKLSLAFRSFDTKVVNGGADGFAAGIKSAGHWLRDIQTGRIQNYLLLALVSVVLLIALYITLFS